MKKNITKKKSGRKLSWNEDADTESEDRVEYLKLSPKEKWEYLMNLILTTYPSGKKATYKKRIIEWK